MYDFVAPNSEEPLQGGVTVSSRKFRKAVERNRVKRILREAYRLQKPPLKQLLENNDKQLAVFFIYVGKELPNFEEVNKKMGSIIKRLTEIIAAPKVP